MCGITGHFSKDRNLIGGESSIRAMTDVLSHRGPDDAGYYVGPYVALGHRRLSIIDLESGKQPIFNEDRTMAIVFNGEVYNFEELQEELEKKGHRFTTRSDTEVLLHAYEEWGESSPTRLRGMFSYAIWDGPRRSLFLARDRIGKKPLYYADSPDRFLFASELKALLAAPGLSREIDLESVSDYLSFLYVPAPKSIFRSIRKLPAGHSMTVTPSGTSIREYWDIRFASNPGVSEGEAVDRLSDLIRRSVEIRLKSEVPLGAFLSGGLDSSLVVGEMASLLDRPVETNSVGFTEVSMSELPYARSISSRFRTNHHEFTVDTEAASMMDLLASIYDEPFADSSSIPTYHVSRMARRNVTVALSGDGGDENFGGYRRYYFDLLENRIRESLPATFRRSAFGALAAVYPKGDWMPQKLRAKTMLTNLSLSPERGYYRTMCAIQDEMKAALFLPEVSESLRGYESFSVLDYHFRNAGTNDPLSRIQYVDIKTYLPDDILVKVDRASMASSLEVRSPLLDHELMEFAASLPSSWKLRGKSGKYILKRVAERILPRESIHRKKMGFSVPLDEWLRGKLKSVASDLLLPSDSRIYRYLSPRVVEEMWRRHQAGWSRYGTQLWQFMTFEAWHRRHLG